MHICKNNTVTITKFITYFIYRLVQIYFNDYVKNNYNSSFLKHILSYNCLLINRTNTTYNAEYVEYCYKLAEIIIVIYVNNNLFISCTKSGEDMRCKKSRKCNESSGNPGIIFPYSSGIVHNDFYFKIVDLFICL